LIDAKIARVVIAAGDPDERVAGRGVRMLRDAGIQVDSGLREAEARQDHAGFLLRVTEDRPFVTLKMAGTLDGRIATATGESQWITGPDARRDVHMMRARHDAVMVGAGTVRADDPSLTVRGLGVGRQPVRIIVSNTMKISSDMQLAQTATDVPVWLCHGADADVLEWTAKGALSLPSRTVSNQIDPQAMMTTLATKGITRLFCEGGGMLAASLLSAGVVDQLVVYSAGAAIGAEGAPMLAAMGVAQLEDAPRFALDSVRPVGNDIRHIWRKR
jgi:diaminohydroxyphosphoribosylaminopyrimidine deaminase/5-amino-6-(5-phosphoribosylamino)uracil reductase